MVDNIKVLAQLAPSANTLTDFYTAPLTGATATSSIVICNQNPATQIAFRVSIAIGGAADSTEQYIYFDIPLMASDTFIATVGMTLASGDVIRVRTDTTGVSFTLFGVEVT